MSKKYVCTLFNVIGYVFLIITSIFINGATVFSITGDKPLFKIAPYAFLIWIIIYLLFGVWLIRYGFKRTLFDEAYMKISRFLPISLVCAGATLWGGQPVAFLFIIGALISSLFMYLSCQQTVKNPSFLRVPLSIYLAWLSMATLLEGSLLLKVHGLMNLFGLPELFWVILILIVTGFIAISFNSSQNDFMFPLVYIWVYIALAIQHLNNLIIVMVCCGVILLIGWMMDRYKKISSK